MKKERYNIKGMHCSNCSIAIENSINKLEGIKKVDVNPISSQMIVEYDEDKLNSKDIEKNVESIGYEAYLKIKKGFSFIYNFNIITIIYFYGCDDGLIYS